MLSLNMANQRDINNNMGEHEKDNIIEKLTRENSLIKQVFYFTV